MLYQLSYTRVCLMDDPLHHTTIARHRLPWWG